MKITLNDLFPPIRTLYLITENNLVNITIPCVSLVLMSPSQCPDILESDVFCINLSL